MARGHTRKARTWRLQASIALACASGQQPPRANYRAFSTMAAMITADILNASPRRRHHAIASAFTPSYRVLDEE